MKPVTIHLLNAEMEKREREAADKLARAKECEADAVEYRRRAQLDLEYAADIRSMLDQK